MTTSRLPSLPATLATAAISAVLAGCSLTPASLTSISLATATVPAPGAAAEADAAKPTPAPAAVPEAAPKALPASPTPHVSATSPDASAEVYGRIARGALRCWFAPEGPLKRTHVFNARVDPQSAGGGAEILIQTRETPQPGQGVHGSLRSYRILFTPSMSGTVIEAENLKFADAEATAMSADVVRWIKGDDACGEWPAPPPGPTAAPTPPSDPPKAAPRPAAKAAPSKS